MKQLIFKVDILLPEYGWEGDLEKFTNAKGCFLRCARLANIGSVWFDNEHNWLTLRVYVSLQVVSGPTGRGIRQKS